MEAGDVRRRTGVARFEERKHPRFLLNLPVEYYRLKEDSQQAGYTINASEGGLMVTLSEKLEVGELLKIKLFFSFGPEMNAIESLSRVVWTNRGEKDEEYRTGVQFLEISPEDQNRLSSFLRKMAN